MLSEDEGNNVVKKASFKAGQILVSFECTTASLVLPDEFKCKKTVESDISIEDEIVTESIQNDNLKDCSGSLWMKGKE